MSMVLKAGCLVAYAAALASLAGLVPAPLARPAQVIAAVLLGLHAVEALVMFKHVRRYQGPLAVSVVLTVLFGLLHWLPLAKAARAERA